MAPQSGSTDRDTVFLHIGTRKSGTSYVQKALRESVPQLDAQGLHLAYVTRRGQVERQLEPFQAYAAGGPVEPARESIRHMMARFDGARQTRHLVTLEDLAELPQVAADEYVCPLLERYDVHLLVTARHWGLTIPSEWQQDVKERRGVAYRDFLDAIRDRTAAAERFLRRQDLPALLQRWGRHLPADRIHVVAVPPSQRSAAGAGAPRLLDLFCGLIGIDPATLQIPDRDINTSLSLDQAELVRRVNVALGDRLPDLDTDYHGAVRQWLTRGSLMQRERHRILIPTEDVAWCAEAARAQFEAVTGLGVDIVGDPADLVPAADVRTGPVSVGDAEISDLAINVLADLAVRRWKELSATRVERDALIAERDALAARITELEASRRRLGRIRARRD